MIRRLIDALQNRLVDLLGFGNRRELAEWAHEVTAHARREAAEVGISDDARARIRAAITGGDREVKP